MYDKSVFFIKKGGAFNLSAAALSELLQGVLAKGCPFRFQAKGFSMSPCIKDGDVVTVSPFSNTIPRCGDIVAFINSHTKLLAVHRVVAKRDGSFFIKGDNVSETDGLIRAADILGHVTELERDGKSVYLGLGPERFMIALLNRRGLLFPLLVSLGRILRKFRSQ